MSKRKQACLTLRLSERNYGLIQQKSNELGVSMNSLINIFVDVGYRVVELDGASLSFASRSPQSPS